MKTLKFKRIFTALLAVMLIVSMAVAATACGKKSSSTDTSASTTAAAEDGNDGEETKSDADLSSIEFVRKMGNGINLGNTLEAYNHAKGTNLATKVYETTWGQPVTTQDMINGMKAAGFDTIRIPVSWTNMMNFEDGDYTIGAAYLDRVEEITKWAVDAGMYVIINDHWDGGWWGMFGSATEETRTKAMTLYTEMWKQIADRFKDYSYNVILESANEQLGSGLNETTICKDTGTLTDDEMYEITNKINQAFVDTVRAAGGYNEDRFLLIAGYNTDITKTCDDRFVMPTDTAKDKLLISVHFYEPWSYCAEEMESAAPWGTKKELAAISESLNKMTKFTDKGIGVVIGEYAAMPLKDKSFKENMNTYHANILDICDINDYCPILWDRGDFFSKTDCKLIDSDMAKLFASRNYENESKKSVEDVKSAAKTEMEAFVKDAPETFAKEEEQADPDSATAWIMYNGGGVQYSVGDTYNPAPVAGVTATDVKITGAGTYTVALDFSGLSDGKAYGITFSAVGLSNGEILYPGYTMDIKEIKINGKAITLTAKPYTASDDEKCTRVNFYNEWVSKLPDDAHTLDGNLDGCSAVIVDKADFAQVEKIEVTFDYVAPQ